MLTFSETRGGIKTVCGTVTRDDPVQFHNHNKPHRLICCENLIVVETEKLGTIQLLPGKTLWVEAGDRHRLTAPCGPAKYACVGAEGF